MDFIPLFISHQCLELTCSSPGELHKGEYVYLHERGKSDLKKAAKEGSQPLKDVLILS